jgi:hypothetical protein
MLAPELSVGNVIRRVLFLMREEYSSKLREKVRYRCKHSIYRGSQAHSQGKEESQRQIKAAQFAATNPKRLDPFSKSKADYADPVQQVCIRMLRI